MRRAFLKVSSPQPHLAPVSPTIRLRPNDIVRLLCAGVRVTLVGEVRS